MRVLVVGGGTHSWKSLVHILQEAGHEAVLVHRGAEALAAVRADAFDVALLDGDVPGMAEPSLCRELRAGRHVGPILALSHALAPGEARPIPALDPGPPEPAIPARCAARAGLVMRCVQPVDAGVRGPVLCVAEVRLALRESTVRIPGRPSARLTPIEARILEVLMRHSPATMSREELADQIGRDDVHANPHRLDVQFMALRRKLELDPARPRYLHTVPGRGYAFRILGETRRDAQDQSDNVSRN